MRTAERCPGVEWQSPCMTKWSKVDGEDIWVEVRDIDGNDVPMERYRGQVLLIVNTASRCGFTRQYADLQNLF